MSVPSGGSARGAPGASPESFLLEIPSDLRLVETAVAYVESRCRAHRFQGSRLTLNLRVGVAEALANAILYGNASDPGKRVRVEVVLDAGSVCIEVRDEGAGFDPAALSDPTTPENRERAGGRGIFLLRKLMDEVHFNRCGNAVRLVLRSEPGIREHAGGG